MVRRRRPYLPGAVFHLTARTQGHEPWFRPALRTRIVGFVDSAMSSTDAQLIAYTIMPNHLHLVVRQGNVRLGYPMQILLRRTALLIQRAYGIAGHVFERRYGDQPCTDPEYMRNVIVYTHLNPVRAGLCDDPADYEWGSHRLYRDESASRAGPVDPATVNDALRLFATGPVRTARQLRADYQRFVDWRVALDRYLSLTEADVSPRALPPRPDIYAGDWHWLRDFARPIAELAPVDGGHPLGSLFERTALSRIARQVVREHGLAVSVETVKGRYGGRRIVAVRREVIRRAATAGYRGVEIARFLNVSESSVSKVVAAMHDSSAPG